MPVLNWFEVDKEGLRRTLERRGKEFAVFELVQNAWDENSTRVDILLQWEQRKVVLAVKDDSPEGFRDLSEAYTLYSDSYKKGDPEKRGAFNIGDKFVLALCSEASISTTKGTIVFNGTGRHRSNKTTQGGSVVEGIFRATREEFEQIREAVLRLIPPKPTFLNGVQLQQPDPLDRFETTLPTMLMNPDGVMVKSNRKTAVLLHNPKLPTAWLYEMGIPIVELGDDRWDVDVMQKVPLNMERDNVTPAFLKALRVAVLNQMASKLEKRDSTANWVREAASDPRAQDDAVTKVVDLRFGEKRVIYDMSDPEANAKATAQGFTVVSGGSLSSGEWDNVKRAEAILPAGQVTPSAKPYSPDGGNPKKIIERDVWSRNLIGFEKLAQVVAEHGIGGKVSVVFVNDSMWPFGATFGPSRELTVNVGRLGYAWFDPVYLKEHFALLIHEYAHMIESNHLSSRYYEACCDIGSRLVIAAQEGIVFANRPAAVRAVMENMHLADDTGEHALQD